MKILFTGQIGSGQTSLMRMRALTRLGHVVLGVDTAKPWHAVSRLSRQLQRRMERGSVVDLINESVIKTARDFRPDLLWAEKQEFLRVDTLAELRAQGARLVHFTPDPYFTLPWKRTRLMDTALTAFDALIYCKSYEREAYEALGKALVYMPLGYCAEVHRPLPSNDVRWKCAVGFLGGWEPRREHLLHAAAAAGADLKFFGGYWEFLRDGRWTPRRAMILRQLAGNDRFTFHRDGLLASAYQGGEVYGDDYARALTGAKIGVGFLRRVCADQHTTRTFEIPACGSMLLADRTDEHREFFEEGKEADFFATPDEFVDKVAFYSAHEPVRERIAKAGRQRCVVGKYAYVHRVQAALNELQILPAAYST